MFRLQSLIHAGHTLITDFWKLKGLSSLNIRNYYYYYYILLLLLFDVYAANCLLSTIPCRVISNNGSTTIVLIF